ncbi:MAG: aldose 1-epimerase [Pseudomonadota bacterium]|nr:aldose 1-epimerase [Pseudomonadota bacterium]
MICLEAHDWRMEIDALTGAGVAHLSYQGQPVWRDRDPRASDFAPLQMSCFPLVPFSNRIFGSRFSFGGQDICLPLNMPGEPNPIHGTGWTHPWDVVDLSEGACSLAFRHEPGAWPWRFHAVQDVRLGPDGMVMELRLTNESADIMPAGLGFHPYFHTGGGCELKFAAKRVWMTTAEAEQSQGTPVPARWDFHQSRPVEGLVVDHCFSDWDGTALISWPGTGLAVEMTCSPNARHATVFSPAVDDGAGPGFFCLEPVTHVSNALNFASPAEAGIEVLQPGATMSLVMQLKAVSPDRQA